MVVVLLLMEEIRIRSWWIVYPIDMDLWFILIYTFSHTSQVVQDFGSIWKSCKPDPKMPRFDSICVWGLLVIKRLCRSWKAVGVVSVWWISRLWYFDLMLILRIRSIVYTQKTNPLSRSFGLSSCHHVNDDISWDLLEDEPPKVWRPLPFRTCPCCSKILGLVWSQFSQFTPEFTPPAEEMGWRWWHGVRTDHPKW